MNSAGITAAWNVLMNRPLGLTATVVILTAISADNAFAQKSGCDLRSTDSVYLAGGPVYRDCAVDKKVRPKSRPSMTTVTAMPRQQCMAAAFEFVVDTLGWPEYETIRLIRTNDGQFADAMRSSIRELVFTPATKDGVKVRQIFEFKTAMTVSTSAGTGRMPSRPRPTC